MQPDPYLEIAPSVHMPMIGLGTQLIRPNDKTFNINDWAAKAV